MIPVALNVQNVKIHGEKKADWWVLGGTGGEKKSHSLMFEAPFSGVEIVLELNEGDGCIAL